MPSHAPILSKCLAGQGSADKGPVGGRAGPRILSRLLTRRATCLAIAVLLWQPADGLSQKPGKKLLHAVAQQGTLLEKEREHYTFRQEFRFQELDRRGQPAGFYHEVRDVLFDDQGERVEKFIGRPQHRLQRLQMTEEDIQDMRQLQPFVLTSDTLGLYELDYKGGETIDGLDCYVFRIQPRQLLEGQRLVDGLIWVSRKDEQVVRIAGKPLPQIHSGDRQNLFAHFTTIYAPVDGRFWFPAKTVASDTLPFRSGPEHVRYVIEYTNYKRFTTDSSVTFDPEKP